MVTPTTTNKNDTTRYKVCRRCFRFGSFKNSHLDLHARECNLAGQVTIHLKDRESNDLPKKYIAKLLANIFLLSFSGKDWTLRPKEPIKLIFPSICDINRLRSFPDLNSKSKPKKVARDETQKPTFLRSLRLVPRTSTKVIECKSRWKNIEQLKMNWVTCLQAADPLDGLSKITCEDGEVLVKATREFFKGEFVVEWNGGLTARPRKAKECDLWPFLRVLNDEISEEVEPNLTICALTVHTKLRIFFTARRRICPGNWISYSKAELLEKQKLFRKRNRITFK